MLTVLLSPLKEQLSLLLVQITWPPLSASTVEGVAAAIKAVHAPQLALNNLNLVGHANGAIVPAEGAAIVAARANHLAAHSASTVEGVAAAIKAAHAPQLALNNLNLVGHANGAIV